MRRAIEHLARAVLLCAVVTAAVIGQSQSPSTGAASNASSSQVEHITLPQVQTQIPPGPHVDVYENNCLICHSARYVLGQPRFPKDKWQAEVKKMVDAYGASISEADQALIVEYLVAVKGSETPASSPAK